MCGIAGTFEPLGRLGAAELEQRVSAMADQMVRRGPDGSGTWVDDAAGIALGHRRLAIQDLSPAGRQPMVSSCGRFVLTYNGEIYNAPALRAELLAAGRRFRGHSDTEIIVEAVSLWGLDATLARLAGMFALGLWDRATRRLQLVRDRLGIKPLYWGALSGGGIAFASELNALRRHPGWQPTLDRDALATYLRFGYVPAPHTIYRDVAKLRPGHVLTVADDGRVQADEPFWNLAQVRAQARPFAGSEAAAVDALEQLLSEVVAGHTLADVPLGAFLSGGIDSSLVVALLQRASTTPVRTFTIGFSEDGYNEADHARAVAAHLGTDHTELHLSPSQALDLIPGLPDVYDEPFADASQLPTLLVSQLARRQVTVALSGDGGDEVFAGYNRYLQAPAIARRLACLPVPARRMLGRGLTGVPPGWWDALFRRLPGRWPSQPGDKVHKLARVLDQDCGGIYRRLVSQWDEPDAVVAGGREYRGVLWDAETERQFADPVERMQYVDTLTYLPDDILTKVDRATMAVSLEARVPLLDHRVVEFAWTLPPDLRIRAGQGKWLLRQVLHRHVPPHLVERPKMGFGVPIDAWLRGPLRDWAEALLDEKRLREQGLFLPEVVRTRWREHLSGGRNWQYPLWTVLMAQAWLDRHGAGVRW